MKILIAEDNELNAEILERKLVRKGIIVLVAKNGKEAIEMAESELPDLIIMDMRMPVLDGWAATAQLKQSKNLSKIPVIGFSAHALPEEIEKAMKSGCDDYDVKPLDFNRLYSKIMNLLK